MRPVNKGDSPYTEIKEYSESLPYLERAIGGYCSYCEYPIRHLPEVEHKVAKAAGGSLTEWKNLLLSCKYCNTRKGTKVGLTNADEFLWPDTYNTAMAFTYEKGIPQINEPVLLQADATGIAFNRAKNLFDALGLGKLPSPGKGDRRFLARNSAYELAIGSLEDWKNAKGKCSAPVMKRQIVRTAKESGFFSIWMTVFSEESELMNALIQAFPGTRRECFDSDGRPKPELLEIDS